ncbi:unnamed protein product [Mortierella alpina]
MLAHGKQCQVTLTIGTIYERSSQPAVQQQVNEEVVIWGELRDMAPAEAQSLSLVYSYCMTMASPRKPTVDRRIPIRTTRSAAKSNDPFTTDEQSNTLLKETVKAKRQQAVVVEIPVKADNFINVASIKTEKQMSPTKQEAMLFKMAMRARRWSNLRTRRMYPQPSGIHVRNVRAGGNKGAMHRGG